MSYQQQGPVWQAEITPGQIFQQQTNSGKTFFQVTTAEGYNLSTWSQSVAQQLQGAVGVKTLVTLKQRGRYVDILGLGVVTPQPRPNAPMPPPVTQPQIPGMPQGQTSPAPPSGVPMPPPVAPTATAPTHSQPIDCVKLYSIALEYTRTRSDVETVTRQKIVDEATTLAQDLYNFVNSAPGRAALRINCLRMAVPSESMILESTVADLIATATQYENEILALERSGV